MPKSENEKLKTAYFLTSLIALAGAFIGVIGLYKTNELIFGLMAIPSIFAYAYCFEKI